MLALAIALVPVWGTILVIAVKRDKRGDFDNQEHGDVLRNR